MNNVKKAETDFNITIQNHQKNNFKVAEKIYKRILKIFPNHFQSNYLLATLFLQTKKLKDVKTMNKKINYKI